MQLATVREFRSHLSEYLDAEEAVVVTKHGKPTGFYLPLAIENETTKALKRKLFMEQSEKMSELTAHIDEKEMIADFEKWRKERRRNS